MYTVPQHFKWLNWQEIAKKNLKTNKTFKITEARHLTVSSSTAKIGLAHTYFSPSTCEHAILKRGKKLANIEKDLKEIPCVNHIKIEKKDDVKLLLNKMGYEVEDVIYYKEALHEIQDNTEESE